MAPTLANWKKLIDNGNSVAQANVTDLVAKQPESDGDPVKRPPSQQHGWSLNSDLLPVYCGVLGCLIVGLVAWILFKQLRRRPAQEDKLLPDQQQQQQSPAAMEDDEHQHQHHHRHHHRHHRQEQPQFQQPHHLMGRKRKSADSGFFGSEAAATGTTADGAVGAPPPMIGAEIGRRLLRDLSESRLQRLENILANDPNPDGWRRLAKELGLNSEDLERLESQSARGNQSAIRLMLKTWAAKDGSSVSQLTRCLQRAGRSDALILFRESAVPAGLRQAQRRLRKQQQQLLQEPQQEQQKEQLPEGGRPVDSADMADAADVTELSAAVLPVQT